MATAVVAANIVAVAATAAITYALTNDNTSNVTTTPSSATPSYSDTEQSVAKDKVCKAFDTNQRGSAGQGGLIDRGELNVPVVLRAVNSVAAVQDALTPAASPALTSAVENYVSTTLDLTSAALANVPVEELNQLNDVGNAATYALADVCGIPR